MNDDTLLKIFTVPKYKGNAYIMEKAGNGGCEFLWSAPLFKDNTVDHSMWNSIEDEDIINDVVKADKKISLEKITVEEFTNAICFGSTECS